MLRLVLWVGWLSLAAALPLVAQDAPKEPAKDKDKPAMKADPKGKADPKAKASPEPKEDEAERWARKSEDQPFPLGTEERPGNAKPERAAERSFGWLLVEVILYLLLVLGLLYATAWMFRRFLPGRTRLLDHPGVVLLGRSYIAPKQAVMLVRVGARVLVLGVSGDRITTLSTITDAEEIAVLERQSSSSGDIAAEFRGVLKGAIDEYDAGDSPESPAGPQASTG